MSRREWVRIPPPTWLSPNLLFGRAEGKLGPTSLQSDKKRDCSQGTELLDWGGPDNWLVRVKKRQEAPGGTRPVRKPWRSHCLLRLRRLDKPVVRATPRVISGLA